MAAHLRPPNPHYANLRTPPLPKTLTPIPFFSPLKLINRRKRVSSLIRASDGESYLDMWKKAVEREKKEAEFQKIVAENTVTDQQKDEGNQEVLQKKSEEFEKLLEVPKEDRDRVQRMQVIDRAAAAIAAARALIKENPPPSSKANSVDLGSAEIKEVKIESSNGTLGVQEIDSATAIESNGTLGGQDKDSTKTIESNGAMEVQVKGTQAEDLSEPQSESLGIKTPGPDFWSWTPPTDDITTPSDSLQTSKKPAPSPKPTNPVMLKEKSLDYLSLPFQSTSVESHSPPLPPLQSLMEVEKAELSDSETELHELDQKQELGMQFSVNAEEATKALHTVEETSNVGVKPDGSKWWKETGVEQRPNGVVCRWTLIRGVSADKSVEWEEKFWEAADDFEYKELGSEKSGRDARGNVWREYWKESMWQDLATGLINMEKTADKWGKNGYGGEWHEKWWEHYDASGQAEKWAHKWCGIDPYTPLEAGHAHVWHERWGEKYDGQGSSTKYTDKWAERLEGDGWTKWGDKWDENFNQYGQGVKQGEKWWQGKYGEKWNRTWGEGHNGSGWIHKYGKSSCGEHWDTHVEQDTWYERYPHFGFQHCFENSRQLREVRKPPEAETP